MPGWRTLGGGLHREARATGETGMAHEHAATSTREVVDPICGMRIDPDGAAATREYDGSTYCFCSRHCAATFDEDPKRYGVG
jgi:Cu+-exporting ATPase